MNEGNIHIRADAGNTSLLILAGGRSSRMGYPKLLLPFKENQSFIGQILEVYQQVLQTKPVIVLNVGVWEMWNQEIRRTLTDCEIVINANPELGRMHSIRLGLQRITQPHVFIQNSDNPFVTGTLLNNMLICAPENGYVSPRFDGKGGHPVLLCGDVLNQVVAVRKTDWSLRSILRLCTQVELPTNDPQVLADIDTPERYQKYFPHNRPFSLQLPFAS